MTRFLRPITSAVFIAGLTAAAFAQTVAAPVMHLKPGLWEVTSTMKMGGLPAIDTSKMTDQQKAMIQTQMAAAMSKPSVSKVCITPDQFQKMVATNAAGQKCSYTVTTNTANKFAFHSVCAGATPTDSTITIEATAMDSYNQTAHIVSGAQTTDMTSTAKWTAADCGTVK